MKFEIFERYFLLKSCGWISIPIRTLEHRSKNPKIQWSTLNMKLKLAYVSLQLLMQNQRRKWHFLLNF